MGSILRFSVAVSALVAACSTQGSGLDSESHFACGSDADCAIHSGRPACVERVCEPLPDASMSETGGKAATGRGASMNTGGAVNMSGGSGGAAGHGNTSTGGRSPSLSDAMPPKAGPHEGTPLPDAGICKKCTKDLPPAQSLACYCSGNSCDADLATALANPIWQRVDEGCGLIVVYWTMNLGLGSFGAVETFDRSGRLVGAASPTDEPGLCISPNGSSPAGGNYDSQCTSTKTCTLKEVADGGLEGCDLDALLSEVGADAGPPCAAGEVRASVCTSCLAGCGQRELKCVKTCDTTADCTAAHVTGTCVDSICQEFCPF